MLVGFVRFPHCVYLVAKKTLFLLMCVLSDRKGHLISPSMLFHSEFIDVKARLTPHQLRRVFLYYAKVIFHIQTFYISK